MYLKTRGEPLTQSALKNLQRATALLPNETPSVVDVQQTFIAFQARRDDKKPAGEYDFALRPNESSHPTPTLRVTELQAMVSSPAIVWLKRYLGVEAPVNAANPWAAATGKWVHRWLAGIGEKTRNEQFFAPFPGAGKIDERLLFFSEEYRTALQQLCDSLGKIMPDWWRSGWLNARYLARHLGDKISRAEDWRWMATAELAVGRNGAVKIADEVELLLRGQIDLILGKNDAPDFTDQQLWIVDYKTGNTKKLSAGDLHDSLVKGTTLQLGLYALALRALGAAEVGASIISPAVKDIEPQMSVADLAPHTNVFADLAEMQRTGVFGMKGELRPSFGASATYPLATLRIDEDILNDKWALTHPNLVLEKEEWETW